MKKDTRHSTLDTVIRRFALLCLALCVVLFAAPGWAMTAEQLQSLIDSAPAGGVIKITETVEITSGTVTINGKGCTLKRDTDGVAVAGGSVIKINGGTVNISDLTITGGNNATGSGGGIWAPTAQKVTITNCVFKDNTATTTSGESYGGGVYFGDGVQAIEVAQCTFINNKVIRDGDDVAKGGGMYLALGSGYKASVVNCTFTGNTATNTANSNQTYGGGLYTSRQSADDALTVNFCTFVGNTAKNGAQIYGGDFSPTVKNSIIYGIKTNDIDNPENCLTADTTPAGVTSQDVEVEAGTGKIKHTVFYVEAARDTAVKDTNVTEDQLNITRRTSPTQTAGAVELKDPITVSKITAKDKTYDGTTNVSLDVTFTGKQNGDDLTVTATGAFKDANVGTGKTVNITGLTLGGTSAAKYELAANSQQTTTAAISKRPVTVTAEAQSVTQNSSIDQSKATLTGALTGHSLDSVKLTADTGKVTTSGKIEASDAKIVDANKSDVTANYYITYQTGTLTVTASTLIPLTIKAKDQTVNQGGSIKTGTDQVTVSGLLSAHTLSAVTLTSSSTASAGNGTITPSKATIRDTSGNDVTANYDINYVAGKLTVNAKAIPDTGSGSSGSGSKDTANQITVSAETVRATVGSTVFSPSTITLGLPGTFNNFRNASSWKVTVKDGDSATTDGITAALSGTSDKKLTFSGSPTKAGTYTFTVTASLWARTFTRDIAVIVTGGGSDTPASKDSVSKVVGYELTVAPAPLTAFCGETVVMALRNNVKFEKVYENGRREPLDAEPAFAPGSGWPEWLTLSDDIVTAKNPPETGTVSVNFSVTATAGGQTRTGEGPLTVRVEEELPEVEIATQNLPDAVAGKPYSAQVYAVAAKAKGAASLSQVPVIGAVAKPVEAANVVVDSVTGRVHGTPEQPGTYNVNVQAIYIYNTLDAIIDGALKAGGALLKKTGVGDEVLDAIRDVSFTVLNSKVGKKAKAIYDKGKSDFTPSDWRVETDPPAGGTVKKNETFTVKFSASGASSYSSLRPTPADLKENQDLKKYYKRVNVTSDYVEYVCCYVGTSHAYEFEVKGKNTYGSSTYKYAVNVAQINRNWGQIIMYKPAGAASSQEDGITLAAEPDGGEPSGVTYFHNGGVDEDGNITAVIGNATEGAGEGYVCGSLDELLAKPKEELNKVIRLEFRKGANLTGTLTASSLSALTALSELSIDECDLTELNLSGMKGLDRLSLYSCKQLTSLNVSGCENLASLSVNECPKLEKLNASGCKALANLDMPGCAELTDLNVSGCPKLEKLNADGCAKLTSLKGLEACPALTDVNLNGAKIASLNLSACSGLKSLSLAKAAKLADLKLPRGVTFEDFTLTGSLVPGGLDLSGCLSLDVLDLTGNVSLDVLDVSGNNALRALEVPNCVSLRSLNASRCPALEELIAYECATLYTMNLEGSNALSELGLGGCNEMRSLNVSGKALGHLDLDGLKWLLDFHCDGQTIGDVTMSQSMDLSPYAGFGLCRVSGVQGCDADGKPIESADWNPETGVATFAALPASVSYSYNTGLYDYALGVTLNASRSDGGSDGPTSNKDGGGCDAGLGAASLAMFTFTALIASRKK